MLEVKDKKISIAPLPPENEFKITEETTVKVEDDVNLSPIAEVVAELTADNEVEAEAPAMSYSKDVSARSTAPDTTKPPRRG